MQIFWHGLFLHNNIFISMTSSIRRMDFTLFSKHSIFFLMRSFQVYPTCIVILFYRECIVYLRKVIHII